MKMEELKSLTEELGYDTDEVAELLSDENQKIDDRSKRMLSSLGLLKMIHESDTTTVILFLNILNNLTGLELSNPKELVEYISKQNESEKKYGGLVASIIKKNEISKLLSDLIYNDGLTTVHLNRDGLKSLVRGTYPRQEDIDIDIIKENGHFVGGFVCEWTWTLKKDITSKELLEIYKICEE